MMKGMFSGEEFRQFREFYEEFSETGIGSYIVNWIKGLILITVVLFVIFVIACFITWSIPLPPKGCNSLKDTGIIVRVVLVVYSFVILLITFGDSDDYGY